MNPRLEIWLAYPLSVISQGFSLNANPSYEEGGLIGHTAVDWDVAWGLPVLNCVENAYCYSILNKDHSDPMKYRSVYTLIETATGIYEVSYGHFSEITAVVGKTYNPGEVLGKIGNTGTVYASGKFVTKAEKLAGSKAGSHLHGPQVRMVKKVTVTSTGMKYLEDSKGKLKRDGFYYEVINYKNGFNGCINPQQFFNGSLASTYGKFVFSRDLTLNSEGQDVKQLQKFLNSKGFVVSLVGPGSPGSESTFFGDKTKVALARFQKASNIHPAEGYFGPKTRHYISTL